MPGADEAGKLPAQVLRFARTLRAAGLPIGPGRVLDALEAAAEVGLSRRDDFYWALHAVLVSRAEHRALFDEAFRLFFREAEVLPAGLELLLPRSRMPAPQQRELTRRLAEALGTAGRAGEAQRSTEVEAALDWSARESLRTRDFEQMSAGEIREAEAAIDRLRFLAAEVPTRRLLADPRGDRVDLRATLRASLRSGPGAIPLRWRRAATREPGVVALCDISGSMARYSRMLLRFLHALAGSRERVHVFTFGTRLTNVTRLLRRRDPDQALSAVGRAVRDWEGGTRIGECLREFNLRWSRRVLGQGAVALLFTDGLDRGEGVDLAAETERLRLSCRRLVWLNPLLRYESFEPLAAGIRAMLPHVDEFRPVNDLASLSRLAEALGGRQGTSPSPPLARGRGLG